MSRSPIRSAAFLLLSASVACGGGSSPPPTPPAAPTGLAVTGSTGLTVHLAWTDESTDETGFELERSTDGADWTQVATPARNATSQDDTVPGASMDYQYRVRATNGAGPSTDSNTVAFRRPNLVFVTSTTYQGGALGGLAGADAACQARADAAQLAGTYRAWLSTDSVDAVDRLGTARGWARPDGKPVADEVVDLASEQILYPPRVDELGNDVGQQYVLTATGPDGARHPASSTCGNYTVSSDETAAIGSSSAGAGDFTAGGSATCTSDLRLYCFGIDNAVPVSPPPVAGRLAFLTWYTFPLGGGLAAADAACAQEAIDRGVSGSFKALLALDGAPASSRFDTAGPPWVRADGLPLTPTAQALFTAAYLDVSFDMDATGLRRFSNHGVWSGSTSWDTAGTAVSTCASYTSTTGMGRGGRSSDTNADGAFTSDTYFCDADYVKLRCLEE